jgi:hypothetical protein
VEVADGRWTVATTHLATSRAVARAQLAQVAALLDGRPGPLVLAGPDSYGVGREVIPEPVEDLLFQPGSAGTVVFALVAVVALTVRRWRDHGPDGRWLVPLVALGLQWPALTAVWHASVAELSRLALPSVVVIRVAIVLQLALLTDAWLRDRRAVEPGGLEPLDGAAADPA